MYFPSFPDIYSLILFYCLCFAIWFFGVNFLRVVFSKVLLSGLYFSNCSFQFVCLSTCTLRSTLPQLIFSYLFSRVVFPDLYLFSCAFPICICLFIVRFVFPKWISQFVFVHVYFPEFYFPVCILLISMFPICMSQIWISNLCFSILIFRCSVSLFRFSDLYSYELYSPFIFLYFPVCFFQIVFPISISRCILFDSYFLYL